MENGIFFSIISLFYSILISIVFFSKERLQNKENSTYKKLLIVNVIGLLIEIIPGTYASKVLTNSNPELASFILKFILLYFITWLLLFTYYIAVISFKDRVANSELKDKYLVIVKRALIFIFGVSTVIVFLLPLYSYRKGGAAYTYGPAADYIYAISGIAILCWIFQLLLNLKYIKNRKYSPIFLFLGLGAIVVVIQRFYPELTLIIPVQTFITAMMYFTIENPDLKMIAELEIARKQAERANAAKTDFLSNMSHEIRTPLNAIVGFSQSLSEENLPDSTREKARDILMASDNLLEIVNGILDISKIEANKLEIVNTEYDMHKVFDELVLLTKARIGEKTIDFRYHLDSSIPAVLYGDYVRLKQIILNLLTNAAKYTKEGFIDFKISTIQSGKVCRLIISVEDSGIGIKQDKINKLFMKFERLDLEKNITIEGTGLGLAITKRLVELMHGRVVVQSVYGKGSKFTVAIDQKIVSEKVGVSKQVEDTPLSVGGKKVLLVDDNKLNLKVASMLLSKYELDITQVGSGYEAIDQILAQKQYDLILLDDMMPKMSGVETLQKLKGIDGFSTPVVVLTANAISGMREKYLKDGFQDYLAKPIDKAELEKVIRKYLN